MQRQLNRTTFIFKLLVAVIATFVAVAASCCLGSVKIPFSDILLFFLGKTDELSATTVLILGSIRIPRVLTAALIGGSLAVIGSVMQGIFRNPMADPSILGVSSGSALGATIAIMFGATGVIFMDNFTGTYIGAIIGAVITWLIVFSIAKAGGDFDSTSTLLAGVAISSITSALITLLMTLHLENLERIYMWMLGSFTYSTSPRLKVLSIVVLIAVPLVFVFAPRIDVLKLGRETSETLGVKQNSTLGILLTVCSVLLAFCVANSGIIGFVGLIIPHIVSFFRVYKARERVLMCFFSGAFFMVLCDTIAKTIVAPGEVSVGAITAIIGAPYFLYLLLKNRLKAGKKEVKF